MPDITELVKQVNDIMEDYQRLKELETKKKEAIKRAKQKYYKKNQDKWKEYYKKRKETQDNKTQQDEDQIKEVVKET